MERLLQILVQVVVEDHVVKSLERVVERFDVGDLSGCRQHELERVVLAQVIRHFIRINDYLHVVVACDVQDRSDVSIVSQHVGVDEHVCEGEARFHARVVERREGGVHPKGRKLQPQIVPPTIRLASGKAAVHAIEAHSVSKHGGVVSPRLDQRQVHLQARREIRQGEIKV